MIIRYFKKGYHTQLVVYIVTIIVLWSDAFWDPHAIIHKDFDFPVYNAVVSALINIPAFYHVFIAFILVIIESLLLNYTLTSNNIIPRNNFLAALIYSCLMSYSPELLTIYPVLIANLFIILATKTMLELYNKDDPFPEIFNAGLMISLATLFYFPSIIFVFLIWASLLIFRIITVRVIFISITGFIIPFVFVAFYYFWIDQSSVFVNKFMHEYTQISSIRLSSNYLYYAFGTLIIFLTIISFIRISSLTTERIISVRKRLLIALYFIVFAAITYLYAGQNIEIHSTLLFVPLTILVTYYFDSLRNRFWPEFFFTLLIIIIIAGKFIL